LFKGRRTDWPLENKARATNMCFYSMTPTDCPTSLTDALWVVVQPLLLVAAHLREAPGPQCVAGEAGVGGRVVHL